MPIPPLPPLRVRESDGDPNVIPVFQITISNGTVVNEGGGKIIIGMGTGAAGAPGASGGMAIGSGVTAGSAGAILFVGSSQDLAQNVSNLFWNQTSLRLGVGTSAPTFTFDLVGTGRTSSVFIVGAQATSASHAVRGDRTLTAGAGLTGGGDLTADRTFSLSTPVVVPSGGTGAATFTAFGVLFGSGATAIQATSGLNAGMLVAGSGLSQNLAIIPSGATGQMLVSSAGRVGNMIWVSTGGGSGAPTDAEYLTYTSNATLSAERILTAGSSVTIVTDSTFFFINALTGGGGGSGASTANSYITVSAEGDLSAERTLTASTGLSSVDGGANSTFQLSVNTNVRDKSFGYFAAGNLSTTMLAEEARIRIPFNMQAIRVDIVASTTASGAAIIVDLNQFNRLNAAGTSMFTAQADQPQIPELFAAGSATTFTAIPTLFAGSFLGFDIDQVGSTVAGSNLTVTVIARAS